MRKQNLEQAIERLRGLAIAVKNNHVADFNSPKYDLVNMLEDQMILVSELASEMKLTPNQKKQIKVLILEATKLIYF